MAYSILYLSILTLVVLRLARYFRKQPSIVYPPGPRALPVVGNVLDIPLVKPWEAYAGWSRVYGQDIVHFKVLGQHMMVINSRELAHEVFEKRSRIYSDRVRVPMIELLGWAANTFSFMPYGDTWRQHRRKFQEGFRDLAQSHRPIQSAKTHELLVNLLRDPNNFRAHIRTLAAATIFGIVYGHDVASTNDYFVELAEKAVGALVTQGPLSAAIVNVFPFMRHLPAWFPGCGFHRTAQEGRRLLDDMVEKPYAIVVNEIASGTHKTSLLATYLEQNQISSGGEEKVLMIKQVCSTTYGAGADTLVSALATFFMAMASHPHAQKKAQEHIDNLIAGEDRLPTWEDRPNLQYIEAVMRETLRYGPVAPLGLFHSAVSDDVVNGYFVPKGTALSGNIWAMTRDPTVYPDPENFIPERFLKEDGTCNDDDVSFTFGFGRRICPGRHLAMASLWAAMASVLATFDISKAKDEGGNEIDPNVEYIEGLVVHPGNFLCSITPRSEKFRVLVADLAK